MYEPSSSHGQGDSAAIELVARALAAVLMVGGGSVLGLVLAYLAWQPGATNRVAGAAILLNGLTLAIVGVAYLQLA